MPAEFIIRRPDIRSAFIRIESANHKVAAAIAEKFPRIALSARGEGSGTGVDNLFRNWLYSFGANLAAPLVDRRRISAGIRGSKAAASELLHKYGRIILRALKEVEDALKQESQQVKILANLDKQIALSKKSIAQMEEDFIKGKGDFLQLLSVRNNNIRLLRSKIKAKSDLVIYRIYLYRALGGGWNLKQPHDTKIFDMKKKKKKNKKKGKSNVFKRGNPRKGE